MYQRLRDNLPPDCRITRIESRVGLGIPDCLIAIKASGFAMVELKVVKRGRKVALSPHQVAFHAAHAPLEAPTFVLVQYHPPGVANIHGAWWYLYRGHQVQDLYARGLDVLPAAEWPADSIRWHVLAAELCA